MFVFRASNNDQSKNIYYSKCSKIIMTSTFMIIALFRSCHFLSATFISILFFILLNVGLIQWLVTNESKKKKNLYFDQFVLLWNRMSITNWEQYFYSVGNPCQKFHCDQCLNFPCWFCCCGRYSATSISLSRFSCEEQRE